jgi:putative transposase
LGINRSRVYYEPQPETPSTLITLDYIQEIWEEYNNKGSRTIMADLREYKSLIINRKKVQRLMRILNIRGIVPKQNLSKVGDLQYKYLYYLAGMTIYMANQAWGTDITYCLLPTGKMYVICLLDIYSRYVVGYVVTNTLETSGCIECLDNALMQNNAPHILNSDQGSQFTSHAWVNALQNQNVAISMDGKGRWSDNIYVERFWKTLKYECIYMLGIETAADLHKQVAIYINYYNTRRLHSALGYKTPESVYKRSLDKNEEFIPYCSWPPEKERVSNSKKTVRPLIKHGIMENKI